MGGSGLNKAIGQAVGNVGGTLAAKTAEELGKTAAEKAAEQIIVTGLSKAAQGAGSAIGNTLLSQAVKGGLSDITGYKTPAEKFAEQPLPEVPQLPVDNTIVVSANKAVPAVPNYGGVLAGVTTPIATEFLPKSVLPEPLPSEPTPAETTPKEEIVVTAPKAVATPALIAGIETAIPAAIGGALTAAQTAGSPSPAEKGGVLGTGLTLPQLISIGGVGTDLLKNLLAGGGGAEIGAPYVSPFGVGTGIGLGTGQDMRANPNIIDYERYGFGPEAMFFQPGYGLLNSAVPAPASPQAQPIMATNPRYEPLI
jgi:hypothetical protein